ncbi:MAG: hypothetical protein J0I12_02185 [Candidatus Eremiobacteraeota bacterium]|nr:hypothetical protein [Candidatus Eremiobacteraeota bacterium]
MKRLFLPLALTVAAYAAPIDGFPPDPPGVVSDRLSETVTLGDKEYPLYAVITAAAKGKPAQCLIYSGKSSKEGMDWKKLYTWNLKDIYLPRSVLRVAGQGSDEIQFYLESSFKYVEGRAIPVLHYYPKTGKFEFQLAD